MDYFDENDFLELRPGAFNDLKVKLQGVDTLVQLYEKELGADKVRLLRIRAKVKVQLRSQLNRPKADNNKSPSAGTSTSTAVMQNSQSSLSSGGVFVVPKPRLLKETPLFPTQGEEERKHRQAHSKKSKIKHNPRSSMEDIVKKLASKVNQVPPTTITILDANPAPTNSCGKTNTKKGSRTLRCPSPGLKGVGVHGNHNDRSSSNKVNQSIRKAKLYIRQDEQYRTNVKKKSRHIKNNKLVRFDKKSFMKNVYVEKNKGATQGAAGVTFENVKHQRAPDYLSEVEDKFEWHLSCTCGNRFLSRNDLMTHLKDKLFGTLYNCRETYCLESFSDFETLKSHSRAVHRIEILQEDDECIVCGDKFNGWTKWEDHQNTCPIMTKTLEAAMDIQHEDEGYLF